MIHLVRKERTLRTKVVFAFYLAGVKTEDAVAELSKVVDGEASDDGSTPATPATEETVPQLANILVMRGYLRAMLNGMCVCLCGVGCVRVCVCGGGGVTGERERER